MKKQMKGYRFARKGAGRRDLPCCARPLIGRTRERVLADPPANPTDRPKNTIYAGKDAREVQAGFRIYVSDKGYDGAGWGPAETPSFAGPGVTYEGKLADGTRLSGQEVVKQWGRPMGSAPPLLTADEWYKLVDSKVDDPQLTPATEPVSPPLSRSADTRGALCLHAMYPAPSRRKLFPHA
jgi:hypothetical protein